MIRRVTIDNVPPPGTPVWYAPFHSTEVLYHGRIDGLPRRLAGATVISLREMERAFTERAGAGKTTVPAALIDAVFVEVPS